MRTAYKCRAYPDHEQMNVLNRTFGCVRAVWNRNFFFCGTNAGRLDNQFIINYGWDFELPSIFTLFEEKGLPWAAYIDPSQKISMSALSLGGSKHRRLCQDRTRTRAQFFHDCASGDLPAFSWVEPCMLFGELDDYHPPTDIRCPRQPGEADRPLQGRGSPGACSHDDVGGRSGKRASRRRLNAGWIPVHYAERPILLVKIGREDTQLAGARKQSGSPRIHAAVSRGVHGSSQTAACAAVRAWRETR